MAGLRGNRGKVVVGASGNVEEITQWSIEESADTHEDTAMDPLAADGPIAKTFLAGNTEWSGSFTCNVKRADADGQGAVRAGAAVALKLYPEADTTGKKYWSGNAIVTRYQEQGEVNGKIVLNVSFKGTGTLSQAAA